MWATKDIPLVPPQTQPVEEVPKRSKVKRVCVVGAAIVVMLFLSACCAYIYLGWFESTTLGKVQHLRRIHREGPHFVSMQSTEWFPRAEGLLDEPFTNNAWTIETVDGRTIFSAKKTWWAVGYDQIPEDVRLVFIASEDRKFFLHPGVDPFAVIRAVIKTLTGRKQGGSTIAMQVAKATCRH